MMTFRQFLLSTTSRGAASRLRWSWNTFEVAATTTTYGTVYAPTRNPPIFVRRRRIDKDQIVIESIG